MKSKFESTVQDQGVAKNNDDVGSESVSVIEYDYQRNQVDTAYM